MSDYIISASGQIISSKSSKPKMSLFFSCSILLGVSVLYHSSDMLWHQERYYKIQISQAISALLASMMFICGGSIFLYMELRYPTLVTVSQDRIQVSKRGHTREIRWHDIGEFKPGKFGVSVSAPILNSELNDELAKSFRILLIGNSASNLAKFLNEARPVS